MKTFFSRSLTLTLWVSVLLLLTAAVVPHHEMTLQDLEEIPSVDVYHVVDLGDKNLAFVSADPDFAKSRSDLQPGRQANPEHFDVPVCTCGITPVECYCYWL